MAIIVKALLKRAGSFVVRLSDRAAGNFAQVRGADLLNGNAPSWVHRLVQLIAPSSLFTRIPLPVAFAIDVSTYAVFDDLLAGHGPVLEFYQQLLIDANEEAKQFFLLGQADELARIFNESVTIAPDGDLVIQVPKLWYRDP